MSTATRPTRRVTARHPFFACTPERDALFAVQPGIPLDAALDTVAAITSQKTEITP